MSDRQNTLTAREQWLNVALAVARDGMTEPHELSVRGDVEHPRVELTFHDSAPADSWAERLGLLATLRELISNDGHRRIATYAGGRADGWHWTVVAYTPLVATLDRGSDLADQVTSAITSPPAIEAQAHVWKCAWAGCTFSTPDGPTNQNAHAVVAEHIDLVHDGEYANVWKCPVSYCGYRIADGPVPDGEETTAELIAEHAETHEDNTRVLGRHPELGLV